jgi:periplasmic protein TonB
MFFPNPRRPISQYPTSRVFSPLQNRRIHLGPAIASFGAHAAAGLLLLLALHHHPVRVFTLPGTNLGDRMEITYLPGRAPAPAVHTQARIKPRIVPVHAAPAAPKAVPAPTPAASLPAPAAAVPDTTTGSDSWGSGSIQIAFTTYSPSPAPDLSVLPRGTQGDVVIDVTIDPNGKVSDLAVLHTVGFGIENSVLNTLRTWTFRPATKDGTPIASIQELHFHFGPV